jgi:hypothetical protein
VNSSQAPFGGIEVGPTTHQSLRGAEYLSRTVARPCAEHRALQSYRSRIVLALYPSEPILRWAMIREAARSSIRSQSLGLTLIRLDADRVRPISRNGHIYLGGRMSPPVFYVAITSAAYLRRSLRRLAAGHAFV